MLCHAVLCCAVLCCAVLCCAVLRYLAASCLAAFITSLLLLQNREATEDVQLGPYHVPAGTRIWINIFSLHHEEKYFPQALVSAADTPQYMQCILLHLKLNVLQVRTVMAQYVDQPSKVKVKVETRASTTNGVIMLSYTLFRIANLIKIANAYVACIAWIASRELHLMHTYTRRTGDQQTK